MESHHRRTTGQRSPHRKNHYRAAGPLLAAALAAAALAPLPAAAAAVTPTTAPTAVPPTAAKPAPPRPGVSFATYNVCKVTCGGGLLSWENRRGPVVRTIAASKADIVAVQEASYERSGALYQWEDLQARVDQRGYTLLEPEQVTCGSGCARGVHLLVRRSTVRVVPPPAGGAATGLVSLRSVTRGVNWDAAGGDRGFAWALVQHKRSQAVFLAVSVHLPNEKNAAGERARRASAAAMAAWAARKSSDLGVPGVPALVAGDLNSFADRQPRGAQQVLRSKGFTDAFAAPSRINESRPTANYAFGSDGWPKKPPRFDGPAPRIDYVFGRGARPLRHEVFLRLTRSGAFDERYRGSDHNLVRTLWRIPAGRNRTGG